MRRYPLADGPQAEHPRLAARREAVAGRRVEDGRQDILALIAEARMLLEHDHDPVLGELDRALATYALLVATADPREGEGAVLLASAAETIAGVPVLLRPHGGVSG